MVSKYTNAYIHTYFLIYSHVYIYQHCEIFSKTEVTMDGVVATFGCHFYKSHMFLVGHRITNACVWVWYSCSTLFSTLPLPHFILVISLLLNCLLSLSISHSLSFSLCTHYMLLGNKTKKYFFFHQLMLSYFAVTVRGEREGEWKRVKYQNNIWTAENKDI